MLLGSDEIKPYLVAALEDHPDLKKVRFLMVFRKSGMTKQGSVQHARVSLIPDSFRIGSKADVLLEVGWDGWQELGDRPRTATIHEQLCHLWVEPRSGVLKMKQPDFYGFHQNLERFGCWSARLKKLDAVIRQVPIEFPGSDRTPAEGTSPAVSAP